ncbi:ABC transporter related [Catenulispora acidiphila DSM 44928]|uniref:ABC transporter related n=1 Tax=Catenulispora acidiphila (strain DSM 44928 / JCM 14897 / NBRC 102108 / NRRL B-24433 / ID139908) TaxID=479433 RepID=C7Q125_CATAD|nr:ABC transporter ATP-binding protein [Catenulispora acidiphila]ACU71700.1 ABC transporter related [Catenulispora acidiphila DSM 44928]
MTNLTTSETAKSGKPRAAVPQQSGEPDPLFGSGISYKMGHNRHYENYLTSNVRDALKALPRLIGMCVRLSLRADRRSTYLLIGAQLALGASTAFGLLATNGVLRALLAEGPSPQRVKAAAPAIVLVCLAGVLTSVLTAASTRAQGTLGPKVESLAMTELLESSVRVELLDFQHAEYHDSLDAGQWGAAWADDLLTYVVNTIEALMALTAAFGVLTVLNPLLLPLLPIAVVPRAMSTVLSVKRRNASRHAWLSKSRQIRQLVDVLTTKKTAVEIRGHGAGDFLLPHYRRMQTSYMGEQTRLSRADAKGGVLSDAGYGASLALIYGLLTLLFWKGMVPLSTAGAAAYAIRTGTGQISSMVRNVTYLFQYGLYLTDWEKALQDSEHKAIPSGGTPVAAPARITAENLTFAYPGAATPALRDVNMTIAQGEVIALVGANGSGKSTLALLLAGLYLPDQGEVLWDGVPTGQADRNQLLSNVAILSQDFPRWGISLAANIAIGRHQTPATPELLNRAAEAAGATELISKYPAGWNTLLATDQYGGVDLSGGQWQKIALGRMHYRDASFLVMDEPTASLDPAAEAEVFAKVRELAGGRTVLLITHRLSSTRRADRIYVLDHGQVVESGTHEELMTAGLGYSVLFKMQAAQFLPTDETSAA